MILFGQSNCIRAKLLVIGKVLLFGQKWLYFWTKVVVFGQNMVVFCQKLLFSGKMVVFRQKLLY